MGVTLFMSPQQLTLFVAKIKYQFNVEMKYIFKINLISLQNISDTFIFKHDNITDHKKNSFLANYVFLICNEK